MNPLLVFIAGFVLGLLIKNLLRSLLGIVAAMAAVALIAGIATGRMEISLLSIIPVLIAARRG